jgi:hypothetical protein
MACSCSLVSGNTIGIKMLNVACVSLLEHPHPSHRETCPTYQVCVLCAQTTDYAGYIRRAFMDEGLMGVVAKLPLERNFKLEHVKEVRAPTTPSWCIRLCAYST